MLNDGLYQRYVSSILLVLLLNCALAHQKGSEINFGASSQRDSQIDQYQTLEAKKRDSLRTKFLQDFEVSKQRRQSLPKAIGKEEEIRIIVRLKTKPPGRTSPQARTSGLRIADEHIKFKQQLQKELSSFKTGKSSGTTKVNFEYSKTFNGFALTTSSDMADKIKTFSMVHSVVEDREVKAVDDVSNSIIGADKVWNEYGLTGNGIIIGIIDTGIDYNHPAMGEGFGASFKVIDGYDFVNDDTNPIDDNGHGTHVAGIAAANGGGLKGVAPNAKLVAYKVLNNYGSGFDSWVLAGIERSTDPDQDPGTSDALDVVNMSLGRAQVADDPVIEAINNAVDMGVTFCVSAGNSGDFFTIGSPAAAEKVITVAATDSEDVTASFSSKGPTQDLKIKPDVAAPGVQIYSSVLNGQFAKYNGTSMAAPHVTGAAALLLERNPDWSPETIKAVLIESAKKTGETIWHQGAGRIDVYEAMKMDFALTPGSVSLGEVDNTNTVWEKTVTATLHNLSDVAKNFSITIEGDLIHQAIDISIEPSTVSLASGESKDITITFTVNPSTLPTKDYKQGYFGALVATSGTESVKTQVALFSLKGIKLQFTGELPALVNIVGGPYYWPEYYFPATAEIFLPLDDGNYDIIAQYQGTDSTIYNHLVFAEGVSPDTILIFDKRMAENSVNFSTLNQTGNTLFFEKDKGFFNYFQFGNLLLNYYLLKWNDKASDTLHFSNVHNYPIVFHVSGASEKKNEFYEITITTGEINSDTTFVNDLDKFYEFTVHTPEPTDSLDMVYFTETYIDGDWGFGFGHVGNFMVPISNPLKLFLTEPDPYGVIIQSRAIFLPKNRSGFDNAWETGFFRVHHDSLQIWNGPYYSFKTLLATLPNQAELHLGESLLRWNGKARKPGFLEITDWPSLGFFNRFLGERERGIVQLELKGPENTLLYKSSFTNRVYPEYWLGWFPFKKRINPEDNVPWPLVPPLTLQFKYDDYKVQGMLGHAEVSLHLISNDQNIILPQLNELSLDVEGVSTNKIVSGQQAVIHFSLNTCNPDYAPSTCSDSGIKTASLQIRKYGTGGWVSLPLVKTGDAYSAELPSTMAEGYHDLKIVATDSAGNILEYETTPAFLVGPVINLSALVVPTQLEPIDRQKNVDSDPIFRWNKINSALSYTFQLFRYDSIHTGFTDPSLLEELTITDTLLHFNSLPGGSAYFWRVRANYTNGSSTWSRGFTFETINKLQVVLINPTHESINVSTTVNFTWEPTPWAFVYYLEITTDPDFFPHPTRQYLETFQNYLTVTDLLPDTIYYWRVAAILRDFNPDYIYSATHKFRTNERGVVLVMPENESANLSTSINFDWNSVNDAISYEFQLSKTPYFSIIDVSKNLTDSSTFVTGLQKETRYYWRVIAFTAIDTTWSSAFAFNTFSPITLVSPANKSVNLGTALNFTWNPVEDTEAYLLQLSHTPNFYFCNQRTVEQSQLLIDDLDAETNYYWRVGVPLPHDTVWSTPFQFTTNSRNLTLSNPANGSADIPTSINFSWQPVTDATQYQLQLSRQQDFSTIDYSASTPKHSYILSNVRAETSYFWRVIAIFPNDTVWSVPNVFTTLSHDVMLVSPMNQLTGAPMSLNFVWEVPEAIHYELQLSLLPDFSVIEHLLSTDQNILAVSNLLPKTVYYWRVQAFFPNDTSMSAAFEFSTGGHTVILVNPADQSVDNPTTLNFTWNPIIGTSSYKLQLSQSDEFSIIDQTVSTEQDHYSISDLLPETTYYWKVGAFFPNDTSWSVPFQFSTGAITGLEEAPSRELKVFCYPNPFSIETSINFFLEEPGLVNLKIINLSGQEIEDIVREFPSIGWHTIIWNRSTSMGYFANNGFYIGVIKTKSSLKHLKLELRR